MRNECSPTEFLRIAAHTAEYFGFKTAEALRKEPECKNCTTSLPHTITDVDSNTDTTQSLLTRGIAQYCDERLHALPGPVLLYSIETASETGETAISFHIFNVPKSIAEAILIQTNRALATELGFNEHTVRINSLGDTDSMTRYSRELTNFLRKRLELMPESSREMMKTHAMMALQDLVTREHDLAFKSPNPLEYLSDQSRKHFRDIIEYLDMSETPYEIDPKMLGHHEYYSDALFAIDLPRFEDGTENPLQIRGGRFDSFVERKTKKKTSAVGAVAVLRERPAPTRMPRFKLETPSVYIIQLGFGPKVRSLMIINELRQAGIPVFQDLANDSLSAQLRDAEKRGVKYVIIIGQKEFVDGTVILRDMDARKQEPIANDQIVRKLKRNAPVTA